ncbi:hypothetical protein S40293_00062 [Stachybotrys chartarum IBT 40293]|nr:hypothetical protein S40293_00062 [Stachybotrys chartarum IBT 40293]
MASSRADVVGILDIIEDIDLPHPSCALLKSYVVEAFDPARAAKYLCERLQVEDASTIVADWRFIVESIFVTGVPPSPPDVAASQNIRRRDSERCCSRIRDMLSAFLTPQYCDWWLAYAADPDFTSVYQNHWLIRKSVGKAFQKGIVQLNRLQSSMIEFAVRQNPLSGGAPPLDINGRYPLLGDHSRSGFEKVDARFVGTHARLCQSIQYLTLEKDFEREAVVRATRTPGDNEMLTFWAPTMLYRVGGFLRSLPGWTLLQLWRRFPDTIRLAAYKGLKRLGAWIYGDGKESTSVQRLPFGLYLKRHSDIEQCHNEFNALRMVRHHTYIPAPKPLDIVCREAEPSTSEWYIPDPTCYILMTQVPGQPIDQCHTVMSDVHLSEVSVHLTSYLSQLREIPQRNKGLISNTLGGACRDTRIRGETPVGPFQDEESFSQLFRFPDDPGRRGHQIVFTHGDLNARNILVGKTFHRDGTTSWKITGIVDWEFAGYMPEYWDCTRSMFERFRWPKRYNNAIQAAFKPLGDYSKELDVEIRAWESGCGV